MYQGLANDKFEFLHLEIYTFKITKSKNHDIDTDFSTCPQIEKK